MLVLRQASQLRLVIEEVENPFSAGLYAVEMLESFCGELLAHVERYYPTGVIHTLDLHYRRKVSGRDSRRWRSAYLAFSCSSCSFTPMPLGEKITNQDLIRSG